MPRNCVCKKGKQRDPKNPNYTVPVLVKVRKAVCATEDELDHMWQYYTNKQYDFLRKELRMTKEMLKCFLRQHEREMKRWLKKRGYLARYEQYEARLIKQQQDDEEKDEEQ